MVRSGKLKLKEGDPDIPEEKSAFQKRKITRSIQVFRIYLGGKTAAAIGKEMRSPRRRGGITHQRVVQILQSAIEYLLSCGWIKD